ncbi:MAG: hypothetical protein LBK71_01490 [Verrucomicrobiales bacterium]|jgi:hypothetical protein|nr:hypothetical protein [Verrucomicrobiales bacterium]
MSIQLKFSTKKYIHKTWDGIRDFFTQYVGVLPGIRERLGLPSPEIGLITNCAAGFGRLNDIIVELEKLTKGFRDTRLLVVTQKNGDLVTMPDTQRLRALLDTLGTINGGLLWLEDTITDTILRNPKHTQADLDLLGVTYQPDATLSPDHILGKLYVQFTGEYTHLHWTLPRGYHLARLRCSINHGEWVLLTVSDHSTYIDRRPIPAQAEIRAYELTVMRGEEMVGKPVVEKVIVGKDITVEEEKI